MGEEDGRLASGVAASDDRDGTVAARSGLELLYTSKRETLAGKKVVVVISGGNIMLETLQAILARRR